jgi:hypothetical protein
LEFRYPRSTPSAARKTSPANRPTRRDGTNRRIAGVRTRQTGVFRTVSAIGPLRTRTGGSPPFFCEVAVRCRKALHHRPGALTAEILRRCEPIERTGRTDSIHDVAREQVGGEGTIKTPEDDGRENVQIRQIRRTGFSVRLEARAARRLNPSGFRILLSNESGEQPGR